MVDRHQGEHALLMEDRASGKYSNEANLHSAISLLANNPLAV